MGVCSGCSCQNISSSELTTTTTAATGLPRELCRQSCVVGDLPPVAPAPFLCPIPDASVHYIPPNSKNAVDEHIRETSHLESIPDS
eukprot:1386238-Amphidinium_carterae.2